MLSFNWIWTPISTDWIHLCVCHATLVGVSLLEVWVHVCKCNTHDIVLKRGNGMHHRTIHAAPGGIGRPCARPDLQRNHLSSLSSPDHKNREYKWGISPRFKGKQNININHTSFKYLSALWFCWHSIHCNYHAFQFGRNYTRWQVNRPISILSWKKVFSWLSLHSLWPTFEFEIFKKMLIRLLWRTIWRIIVFTSG